MIRLQTPSVCGSHTYGGRCSFITILNKMTSIKNEAGNLLPQAFTFNASNQQVRTVMLDGQPYFVAKDVCDVLGHTNPSVAIQMLDDDERAKKSLGRQGEMWLVNESGLYNLIFRSNKPEAKAFRKWVTSEVLPTLRRTGHYELALPSEERELPILPYRRWSQRYERPTTWLDLRSEPYETKMLYGGSVRVITYEDVEWYAMNDVLRALRVATSAYQNAAALNAGNRNLARKILIFGNTHPAWFTTLTGVRLLVCGSRKYMQQCLSIH